MELVASLVESDRFFVCLFVLFVCFVLFGGGGERRNTVDVIFLVINVAIKNTEVKLYCFYAFFFFFYCFFVEGGVEGVSRGLEICNFWKLFIA